MSFFGEYANQMSEAKPGFDRTYFAATTAQYICQIRSMKGDRRLSDNVPYFVAEFDILKRLGTEGNQPGTQASWMTLIKLNTPALANIKELLAATYGVPFAAVDDKSADLAISAEQPFRGRIVLVKTRAGKTQKGGDFTYHNFESVTATPEEIAALRSALNMPALPLKFTPKS